MKEPQEASELPDREALSVLAGPTLGPDPLPVPIEGRDPGPVEDLPVEPEARS